jgi:hypothetical protein
MQQATLRIGIVVLSTFVLQACGTSGPANVDGLRRVVGTDLIGARGATPEDQRKIDRTVVGICAGKVWTSEQCQAHGDALAAKR